MSASNWLNVDNGICTGEVLSDDAIVKILNPSTQSSNNDFKNNNDETENPLCAVRTSKAISAISILIDYLE